MDRSDGTHATAPEGRTKHRAPRRALAAAAVSLAVVAAGVAVGARALRAAVNPSITVSPAYVAEVYYKPTPITITVNAANLKGAGLTPVSGYQYGIQWNPKVLQWMSGPSSSAPPAMPMCSKSIDLVLTPTPWPTGFVPPYTATNTVTATATDTPLAGSTNTPTPTFTPWAPPTITPTRTATATPGGYIGVACATLSNVTPVAASGVLETYTFRPIATAPATTPLTIINALMVDFYGSPIIPATTSTGGTVAMVACHDVNGDGRVTLADLIIVAGHYGTQTGDPGYVALYDVNSDGRINLSDLIIEAAAYNLYC